jgi:hypothetical protein
MKKRVVFIFCDVTISLNGTERTEVGRMAADILNNLPVGTEYRIYPIQAETDALAPINKRESVIPPKDKNPSLQAILDRRRREGVVEELAKYSKETNAPQDTNERRDDNRTCILNALNFAGNQFKQFLPGQYDRELIVISDMLEECKEAPLGRPVNIKKPDIAQELRLANEFPEGNDLSAVKITIITPVTLETYVRHAPGRKPPMAALQEFWAVIFSRCKVTREAQKNTEVYSWSNGEVPGYLLAQTK